MDEPADLLCLECGLPLLEASRNDPCPRCGELARVVIGRAVVRAHGWSRVSGEVVRVDAVASPQTVEAVATIPEATAIGEQRIAAHFDHLLRTYPPLQPGDLYLLQLVNPDTGVVEWSCTRTGERGSSA